MNSCSICNKNSLNYIACDKCFNSYGTLNKYGESMTFFVRNGNIYSEVNGNVSMDTYCTINDVPCYASVKEKKLVFLKIKDTLSFGKLNTIAE